MKNPIQLKESRTVRPAPWLAASAVAREAGGPSSGLGPACQATASPSASTRGSRSLKSLCSSSTRPRSAGSRKVIGARASWASSRCFAYSATAARSSPMMLEGREAAQVDACHPAHLDEHREEAPAAAAARHGAGAAEVDDALRHDRARAAVRADRAAAVSSVPKTSCRRPAIALPSSASITVLPSRRTAPSSPARAVAELHERRGHGLDEARRAADECERGLAGRPRDLGEQLRRRRAPSGRPAGRLAGSA